MEDLKHIKRFNESDENLNISDVIGSKNYIDRISDKYTDLEMSDVKDTLKYTPSEIRHLIKMVFIDGYNKGMSDFK